MQCSWDSYLPLKHGHHTQVRKWSARAPMWLNISVFFWIFSHLWSEFTFCLHQSDIGANSPRPVLFSSSPRRTILHRLSCGILRLFPSHPFSQSLSLPNEAWRRINAVWHLHSSTRDTSVFVWNCDSPSFWSWILEQIITLIFCYRMNYDKSLEND